MLTLAIIGRPNVGKSTFFNRLAGKRLAIVDDTPGVTRDWRDAEGMLYDIPIRIVDTAGLEEAFDDSIQSRMRQQTEAAMKMADVALFMIDGRAGITPLDTHFAAWLRKHDMPVLLCVNKCENDNITDSAVAESWGLGLGPPIALSSEHGIGFDDLYDKLLELIPDAITGWGNQEAEEKDWHAESSKLDEIEGDETYAFEDNFDLSKPIKVAIVGRPNVGKSTLMNTLLGEHRVMVGPEAGITRDAIAADWEYKGQAFKLVDTAGMRKKARVHQKIEKMSVDDSLRAIRLAQMVILVLDGNAVLEKQDLQIADHVLSEGRALVIAVNKWDIAEDKNEALDRLNYKLDTSLSQVKKIPTITISALENRNIGVLMKELIALYEVWNRRVPTGPLNRWLMAMESRHPAPLVQGRPNRVKYITQIKTRPPTFTMWISRPKELADSYKRYIINGLREDFDLPGIPIRLLVRASKNPYVDKHDK
jgi:GTP-binding protein